MIILGFFLTELFFILLITEVICEEQMTNAAVVYLFVMFLGIGCWIYDVSSPYTITTTEIITNDYTKYDLEIDNENIGTIIKEVEDPTRSGAIWNTDAKYTFIDFIE